MARLTSTLLALVVVVAGCSPATPEQHALDDAAAALGGADAVRAAQTLTLEGRGIAYRLGQNRNPDTDLPTSEVSAFKRQIDLGSHRLRTDTTAANFLGVPVTQVAALDGAVAYTVGGNGAAQRTGGTAAADRRAEYYHHPLTLLQAALAEGEGTAATVSNLREEMGHTVLDVRTPDGVDVQLHLDPATNQPVMITSMSYDDNLGDVIISTSFSDFVAAGDLQLPTAVSQKIDQFPALELTLSSTVNGAIDDIAAPAEVASAPEPGPAAATVTAEELASGVWLLAGQSHHSVLVEFPSYTALVEAPQNDTRTLAVIAKARELVPGKPLQYVVNTHHHFDHSGGLRAAVAEGLTIITHEINQPLYEQLVRRPHTKMADRLAQNPAELKIATVTGDEKFELRDGNRVLEAYRIRNDTHNDGILMVYLPAERILVEVDSFTPPRGGPTAENLLAEIKARGLRVNRIAPLHGTVVPIAELQKAVAGATE
jgi:glyoxylase-like metal-dependent hydrolase (beta-lactamase superfamily II)